MDLIENNIYNINGIDYVYINIGKITLGYYSRIILSNYLDNYKDNKNIEDYIYYGRIILKTLLIKCSKIYTKTKNTSYEILNKYKTDFINYYNENINDERFKCIKDKLKSLYFYFILSNIF